MNTTDQLQLLMTELPGAAELVDAIAWEEDHWKVQCLDETLEFVAIYHEADELLTLRTELPSPDPEKQQATHEMLLRLNWIASENNGLRYGLDEYGDVIQEIDVPVQDVDLTLLQKYCAFFAMKAAFLTMAMKDGGLDSALDLSTATDEIDPSTMIRV